jgi:hypothetical protein
MTKHPFYSLDIPYLCNFMFKRVAISFWVLCAFAVLQAHNLIPHHHNEIAIEHSHSHNDHDDDHGDEDTDHSEPFTAFTHSSDLGKVLTKPYDIKEISAKPFTSETLLSRLFCTLASVKDRPRPHPPDDDSPLHLIFLSHSLPLRAPPSSCLL